MGGKARSAQAEMRPPGGKGIRKKLKDNGRGGVGAKGLQRHHANPQERKSPKGVIGCRP